MLEIIVYRHKSLKNVFLKRNWSYCGCGPNTKFYEATEDLEEAIRSVMAERRMRGPFDEWMKSFDQKLYVEYTEKKDMEFDGYKGTLTRETKLWVKDFEKVVFREVDDDNAEH